MPGRLNSARTAVSTVAVFYVAVFCVAVLALANSVLAVLGWTHGNPGDRGERHVVAESRFAVTNAPLQAELVQLVVDFPPGAWTSLHTHGGQAVNLVLEGEITLRHAGMERPYKAGQAWTDSTGQAHAAGNTGPGKARLLTNFLLPRGAPPTTALQDSSFEPTIAHESRFSVPALPADTEIVQQVNDLSPALRAERISGGFMAQMVVEGDVTYQIGTERKTYTAGDAWSAQAGARVTEENALLGKARVFTTYLLPTATSR
jgi:quercetin dioxygenase-like cupin family protein